MKFIIVLFFLFGFQSIIHSQNLTLDELFKINSKGITEIRKILKAKGFSLKDIRKGVHGVPSYTWLSKSGTKKIFFRELDLDEESSTLSYSPLTVNEYESLKKEVLKRGFKQVPYNNYDPDTMEITSYKKGKVEVNFFIIDKISNARYEVAVSD